MAENTLSILETIKKKIIQLDQKADKVSAISEAGDEFQYISSGKEKAVPKAVEVKAPEKPMPKFEDSLGLDVAAPAPIKQPEKAPEKQPEKAPAKVGGMGSFDDFNLDDLDLDNEEKSFEVPANPQAVPERVATERDPNFEEDEAENFEDEIDLEEKAEVVEKEAAEEDEEGAEEITTSEGIDWLGNKIEDSEDGELNFEVDAKIEEKSSASVVENYELDLTKIEDEPEDELDLEDLEEDEDGLDLEDHSEEKLMEMKFEAAPKIEKLPAFTAEEIKNDDLDLEHLEEEELEVKPVEEDKEKLIEVIKEVKQEAPEPQPAQDQSKAEEGLSFDDFEFDEEENEAPKPQQELPSFGKESVAPMAVVQELQTPTVSQQVQSPAPQQQMQQLFPEQKSEAVKVVSEPVVEKHEIDLEFEKEIMGFKSGVARQNVPQPINQAMSQPASNQMPVQNNVAAVSQQNSEVQVAGARQIDSTIRQVNDSVKKLLDAKNVVAGISSFSQSPALSELAAHLMEPKIEKWFNDNLPELVEKIVREEIKKMIPKG